MKKISSRVTFFFKRVFPVLWFGFLGVFLVVAFLAGAADKDPMFFIVPLVMAVFGYFLMKKIVWVLADEVFDCGDFLLVKNRGTSEQVYLSNIMNVSATMFMSPPQITLRLINPGKGGNEVTFSPAVGFSLNPFAKSQIAEDLMLRAYRARESRTV